MRRPPKLDVRWLVFAVVATVAVFSFIVSYSHIYDLGRLHAQAGTAARLLPLSVDLLIVAASLVLFTLERPKLKRSPAFWMPRLVLYAAIAATVAANVAYGLPDGWLSAVISGWPGVAFVAAVEVGILVADPVARAPVPAPVAAPVKRKLPPLRELQDKYNCGQETARKIRAEVALDRSRGAPPAPAVQPPAGDSTILLTPAGSNGNGAHG